MKQLNNFQGLSKRRLQLTGCLSLLDVGGYATSDGKFIRWRTLLRGYSLHRLSPASQQAIIEYGVKTIIDLRTPLDVNREPYVFKSSEVRYFNLPLLEEKNFPELREKKTLLEFAHFMFEERGQQIKEILEVIATNQTAFLIYGASGKDRTGIIIALLLAIAQVPVTTIAQDYFLSEKDIALSYPTIQLQIDREELAQKLLSSKSIMSPFIYLDEHYGGINGYLQAIGVNQETIEHLQTILVN